MKSLPRKHQQGSTPLQPHLLGCGQQTQLLAPLFADLGDDGVEQAELLALLVHLVLWVFKHHLKAVISQNAGKGLRAGHSIWGSLVASEACHQAAAVVPGGVHVEPVFSYLALLSP